ncbi:MAG: hypothetical protein WCK53_14705 [Methanomicrobiales archaeon]
MKMKMIRAGIIMLIIAEAVVTVLATQDVLVLFSLGLMLVVGLLVRECEDWGFYTFTAAIPLVVTTGELYLPAGGILLITTLVLLFLDSCQYWKRYERVGAAIIMLLIVSASIVTPFIAGVTGLGLILLCIAVAGLALAVFSNRLLKKDYLGDMG